MHKVERANTEIAMAAAYGEWLQSLSNDELIEHAESLGIEVEDDDDLDELEYYLSEFYAYSSLR